MSQFYQNSPNNMGVHLLMDLALFAVMLIYNIYIYIYIDIGNNKIDIIEWHSNTNKILQGYVTKMYFNKIVKDINIF